MLVIMSNTHIEIGEGGQKGEEEVEEEEDERKGARQWQRAPQASRERQAGAANYEREGDGAMESMNCGFKAVAAG